MTHRTLLAAAGLCLTIAAPAFAGGRGQHHQNIGHAFKGGNFKVTDDRLFQTLAKDERSQLFSDPNVANSKGLFHRSNQEIWTNSGPDCLVAPVQAPGLNNTGNAAKPKGHHSNQVIWANSGPDCLVAPVQASVSINSGNAAKSSQHEKSNARDDSTNKR